MNPEQNRGECSVCREAEPSFIHIVRKNGVTRRFCTDCLLKVYRELFCPVCFNVFDDDAVLSKDRIACLNCPSAAHLSCSPHPPSSSAGSSSSYAPPPAYYFTCPPCCDPNFTYYPKSRANETPLSEVSLMAFRAAAKISGAILNHAVAQLKDEAYKKIIAAQNAKLKAKAALENLQDIVIRERATEKMTPINTTKRMTPRKRKNDDN